MMSIFKKWMLSIFAVSIVLNVQAQDSTKVNESAFELHSGYVGEIISNLNGGLKKGTNYLGFVNASVSFDTENAKMWKGGSFFANFANTHGGTPSVNLVGDFQGVSNIEAGNITFVYELWYKQRISDFELTFGLQDMNMSHGINDYGSVFSNSSFGLDPCIAYNLKSPIYPNSAIGIEILYNRNNLYFFKLGVFNGNNENTSLNSENSVLRFNKNNGYLIAAEAEAKKSLIKNKEGAYKFGVCIHPTKTSEPSEVGGLFFIANQQLNKQISLFVQSTFGFRNLTKFNCYQGIGLTYQGIITKRPQDIWGIALADVYNSKSNINSEFAVEMTYKISFTDRFYLKPGVQYIIKPSGFEYPLDNALVGQLRFGFEI